MAIDRAVSISLILNPDLVIKTVLDEGIVGTVFEDGTRPSLETIQHFCDSPLDARFIGVFSDRYLGLFMFHRKSEITWYGHTCILHRGKDAYRGGLLALKWMFDHTTCLKIQGETPVDLPQARRFVKHLGFRDEGILRNSYMRNGKVIDQWLLGLEKGELK